MKRIHGLILLSVLVFATFNSCKKNYTNEQSTPITDSTIADLGVKITASVSGFITDENDKAVTGAQVTGGTQTVTTNQYGYFKINNTSLSKTAGFVKVAMSGYFNGYRSFIANEGKETFIRVKLIPKKNIGIINAASGGIVTAMDGSSVSLPANGVVNAINNTAYIGTVNVATDLIDPTANDISLNIPGSLMGIDAGGFLKVLNSYGMLAVELTDASGNLLQIAGGKQATLSFPIPSTLNASSPATIPLWSLNETNGLWKQEASATRSGSNYVGNVGHFSYWNCDIGYSPLPFTAQIVDSALHPLANVAINITNSESGFYNHGFTDTAGFIYGVVPANASLQIGTFTECNTFINFKNFTTTNIPVDLGTIQTQLNKGQYEMNVSGKVFDCNSAPVNNGTVIIYGAKENYITYINNGDFSLNTILCENSTGSIIAIDSSGNSQGFSQAINLKPGINNFLVLSTCGLSTNEFFTVSVDGGAPATITKILPGVNDGGYAGLYYNTDTVTAINYFFGDSSSNYANYGRFSIWFKGHLAPGRDSVLELLPNFPTYVLNYSIGSFDMPAPMIINITEYGAIGEFISGSFTSVFHRSDNGGVIVMEDHTINCYFRLKRTH